jgi:hypothetical protein
MGIFKDFLFTLFFIDSSATSQIPLCWRVLGSHPGLLRLWHLALTTRLDLLHTQLDLIHTRLDLFHTSARSHPLSARSHPHSARLIHTRLDLIR